MKNNVPRLLLKLASLGIMLLLAGFLLTREVTTRQGIDYRIYTLRIPLYLKLVDFFDRHLNYQVLVKKIVQDTTEDEAKVARLFQWTHEHIRPAPAGLPIVDDHVWHIIIRGYETAGKSVKTTIKTPFRNKGIRVTFEPHEIKTLCVNRASGEVTETDLLEEPVK